MRKSCENSEISEITLNENAVIDDKFNETYSNMESNMESNMGINPNISNYSNLTNISNYSNMTSLLGSPKDKTEAIYFLLYAEPNSPINRILEITDLSQNSFYNQKSRDSNIRSKRLKGNIAYYDISPELREQIKLRIAQKLDLVKKEQEVIMRQKILEKDRSDKLNSVRSILKDKFISTYEGNFCWINLKHLQEIYPEVFGWFESSPEETLELLEEAIQLKDISYPIRLSNFSECLTSRSIDSLRCADLDKIVLIKCRVSTLSDVRPRVVKARFECPSCGTIISILQLGKRLKEPTRCSCGRRGGFRELTKDLVDCARVELEDMQDLTEVPQVRSLFGYVEKHLTKSKELYKLNPGSELKLLAVLKAEPKHLATGAPSTSFNNYLKILEFEPFEEVIDVSSFNDHEIKFFKALSAVIKEKNSLEELRGSFAPDIINNDYPKDILLLKAAQGRGRKNKSNILFISDPGMAKSVLVKKYHKIVPGTSYISGAGSSAVGLTATAEKKEDGWILKPGVLATTREDVIADEFNLISEEETPKLQEAMSEGQLTINKASIHAKLNVCCGIVACANPINGRFDDFKDIIPQFNLPLQILNRFDAVFIIKDPKSRDNDVLVAQQMGLRESNNINQKFSDDFLKRFFLYIRSQPEPQFDRTLIETYIPQKYANIRKSAWDSKNAQIINARFIEAIFRLSKSLAKIKMSSFVTKGDIDFSIQLLQKTYLNFEPQSQ